MRWESRGTLSPVSISSTSEEVLSFCSSEDSEEAKKFPLVQLPKKF
jgi:hypothetical protein